MKFSRKVVVGILVIPVFVLITFGAISFSRDRDNAFEIVKQLDIFYSLFRELNLYYVDEIVPGEIIKTGIDAMLESLDPYTVYMPESDIEQLRIMTTGQYGGIGALIRNVNDKVIIARPYQDRPADKAGIITGDIILEIDGNSVTGRSVSDVSELLKGAPNSRVKLKISRPGEEKPLTKEIIREDIKLDAVPYYGVLEGNIGYIALNNFTNTAGKDVKEAFIDLKNEHNIEGLIIDLRGNPGGLLVEAVKIVNLFVDKGQEVVSTKGKVAQWDNVYRALNDPLDKDIKVAVLINRASASASEIVAGALQDLDRGVVIGQQSFGKGLVQTTRELSYNGILKVTTAKYYIPSGRCIQALDYAFRDEEGKAVRTPDSLLTEFSTLNGRKVYEGGGIIPDVIIEETPLSKIAINLIIKNLIFDFATEFRLKNKEIAPPETFTFSDSDYAKFVNFLEGKDFEYETKTEQLLKKLVETTKEEMYYQKAENELNNLLDILGHDKNKDLETFKDEITELISQEIILRYYYEKGGIKFSLRTDTEIEKARQIIASDEKYSQILDGTYQQNVVNN